MKTLHVLFMIFVLSGSSQAVDKSIKQASCLIIVRTKAFGLFVKGNEPVHIYPNSICATGIMISPRGYLLTNNHVVDPQRQVNGLIDMLNRQKFYFPVTGVHLAALRIDQIRLEYEIRDGAGNIYRTLYFPEVEVSCSANGDFSARVIKKDMRRIKDEERQVALLYGDSTDIYVLKVNSSSRLPFLQMAPDKDVLDSSNNYIKQDIVSLPYIVGKDKVIEQHGVVNERVESSEIISATSVELLMLVRPGYSGSAVLNKDNKIIGMIWGYYIFTEIGLMIPIDYIKRFILMHKDVIFPEKVRNKK